MSTWIDPQILAAAEKRLKDIERLETFDAFRPGSRPTPFQSEVIEDFLGMHKGRARHMNVIAGNRCLVGDTLVDTTDGPVPLRDITIRHIVYGHAGQEQKVKKVWCNGIKDVADLTDEFGNKLATCTGNHEFFTQRGKVPAKDLRPSDVCGEWTGLQWGINPREAVTYDLMVSDIPNVYRLMNGLLTSNSGKSQLGARLMSWALAENSPGWTRPERWGKGPLLFLAIGRVSKQVEEVLYRKVRGFFEEGELHEFRVGNALQKVVHKKTGNTLLFASHHNAQEAREKVQAYELHGVWLDEMPSSAALFEELQRRVQDRHGFMFCSFTPKTRNLDIKKAIESATPPLAKTYKLKMFDNPIYTQEDKDSILKSLEGYPENYRRCVLEGDWMDDDFAVYTIPDNAVRAPEGYHPGWRHVEGADPALQSKHGQVILAENPYTHEWYIVKTDYLSGILVPEDLVRAVTERVKGLNIVRRVCDAASTWYIGQASKMGFTYETPYDKNNRREEMMKGMQAALGSKLFIAPWCQDLLSELGSMQWSETSANRVVNSHTYHLHDALIYSWDCVPKPTKQDAPIPELHVRLRMLQEQERKRDSVKAKGLKPLQVRRARRW